MKVGSTTLDRSMPGRTCFSRVQIRDLFSSDTVSRSCEEGICVTPVTPDLSELLVGLLQVRRFPQVLVGVQVDVGVVLPLRRVAVALLALLQALWVRLLVVLLALPVRLVRVEVRVLQVVAVVEPGGGVT
ncbi:hypothetical protein EYF80_057902 [Liparis tanakae]|uniref:Uncharacterized protein n=1 Tax=Liparis tanakae TaxID=230148 RepID=A0A4Z2ET27_9TELE|nr:hypothetical protein EYF80_057902 [Liparis tanakae]